MSIFVKTCIFELIDLIQNDIRFKNEEIKIILKKNGALICLNNKTIYIKDDNCYVFLSVIKKEPIRVPKFIFYKESEKEIELLFIHFTKIKNDLF